MQRRSTPAGVRGLSALTDLRKMRCGNHRRERLSHASMTSDAPQSSIVLYRTEDGRTRIQCRFEDETIWLTQAQIAELFDKDVRTVNEHLINVFDEGELERGATIRKFRIVR